MENWLCDMFHAVQTTFKNNPFYMNVWIILGVLFLGLILFVIIVCYESVRNSIFAIEFLFLIYTVKCIAEKISNGNSVGIVLAIAAGTAILFLTLMFLLIYACQEDCYEGGFSLFFFSIIDGFINLCMISASITIIAIPILFALGAKSWNKD